MMDTVKFLKGDTQVVAHRGLSGLEPENSISAFVAAGNRSYYGIECDVHVTKDGKFVVIHDETTGRVAQKNINVEKSSLKKVRKVALDNICRLERDELGADVHYNDRADLVIPTMDEYIKVCKKYSKKCVLEIKNRMKTKDIERLIEEIKALDYLDEIIFISFSFENVKDLRKLLPTQKIQYLVGKKAYDELGEDKIIDLLNEYSLDIDIHYPLLNKEFVDKIHAKGHIVNCWTCDKREDAEKLVDFGVDQITTNILE